MDACSGAACPSAAQLACAIAQSSTGYIRAAESPWRVAWHIPGTAQGAEAKWGSPLLLGGKKVGRPWRRHAVNPDASWAQIHVMNATLPPAKWLYLRRDPYSQISNCLLHAYCSTHGLDYYANKSEWRAAAPLAVSSEQLELCVCCAAD